jgi:mannose-6-phosphate isomerase-like protein (cupin superfamily)
MGFQVYDYREDMRNVLVTSEVRARFMRIEVGETSGGAQPGRGHSHDLGHEVFMILQGRAEFEIGGETHVLGPGQMCVALVDETHTVRNVGDEPVIMYLSVTPHIQPTHTMWDASGDKAPPRFVPSTTYDVPADKDTPSAELADHQLEAAEALSEATQRATAVQREQLQAFKQAMEAGDKQAALRARDAMWEALCPMFRGMYALAEAWNALTYRTADADFMGDEP